MKSFETVIYINARQLSQLLSDPLFIRYAPNGGKTVGGAYAKSNVFFQLKKDVKV